MLKNDTYVLGVVSNSDPRMYQTNIQRFQRFHKFRDFKICTLILGVGYPSALEMESNGG